MTVILEQSNDVFEHSVNDKNYQWALVKKSLNELFGDNIYYNWLNDLKFEYVANGQVLIKAPSRFVREWVINNYLHQIRNVWQKYDPSVIWVNVYYENSSSELNINESINSNLTNKINNIVNTANKSTFNEEVVMTVKPNVVNADIYNNEESDFIPSSSTVIQKEELDNIANNNDQVAILDPRYTFESFVVGESNEFAFRAAKAVATSNTTFEFNPLFLYSPVGHGKTHLMHAIAWQITKSFPDQKLLYVSAEKFMFEFVKSLRNKDVISFKELFRSVDILMIDDLQFICGKESTQEEFFHTFNALIDGNRKIILACDRSPSELEGLDNRFKSRLGCGLVADIGFSDFKLRVDILAKKMIQMNINVEREVVELLASKITANIRELEGALNKLSAYSSLMNKKINVDTATNILKDLLRTNGKSITVEFIQQKVCEFYKLKVSEVLSSSRERKIARPRQVAMFLCKKLTQSSLLDIGRRFGGRDHTTVMHALKQIESFLTSDNELINEVTSIERILYN